MLLQLLVSLSLSPALRLALSSAYSFVSHWPNANFEKLSALAINQVNVIQVRPLANRSRVRSMCTSHRTSAVITISRSFPLESIAIAVIAIMITIIGWNDRLRRFDVPLLRSKLLLISFDDYQFDISKKWKKRNTKRICVRRISRLLARGIREPFTVIPFLCCYSAFWLH